MLARLLRDDIAATFQADVPATVATAWPDPMVVDMPVVRMACC